MERFVAPTSWVATHGAKIATRTKTATMAIPMMARRLIDNFQFPIADFHSCFVNVDDQLGEHFQPEPLCRNWQSAIGNWKSRDPYSWIQPTINHIGQRICDDVGG